MQLDRLSLSSLLDRAEVRELDLSIADKLGRPLDHDAFFPDYHPEIDDEVAGWLGITAPDDGLVLVIVTVPEQAKNATANLLGPLVINKATRRSIQAVLSEDFSAREPLFRR